MVQNQTMELKQELVRQAEHPQNEAKLTKNMSIPDIVKALSPELKKALPSVITPGRFTRIALSALNNTPELQQCTPMSFIGALLNAAQLGLEVNTPLGLAYLIPYKNKGQIECQFQLGYKGMITLAYRNPDIQTIQAQTVHENDEFIFEYGLNPKLIHRPAVTDRGEPVYFYALFKTIKGGYGYSCMSRQDMEAFAKKYSKAYASTFSPWNTNFEEMAKKTVIKQALKYAPISTELQRALSTDETIKSKIEENMVDAQNEMDYVEQAA